MTFVYILTLTLSIHVVLVHSLCPKYFITTKDIQIAWKASNYVYDDAAANGQKIPGTQFNIIHVPMDFFFAGGSGVKVLIAEYGNTKVISFRGTQSTEQLMHQLLSAVSKIHGHKVTFGGETATINAYFWQAFSKLYDDIESYLNDGSKKYIITGHSLGGAMASILAIVGKEKHSIWNHPESSLITFGQPRVGDRIYANKHDEMIGSFRKLRFVNELDPVPQLLIPLIPPAVHHSREIWMFKMFWTRRNVWKVCSSKDAKWCSKQFQFIPNIHDHSTANYERKILNIPTLFEDQNRKRYSKWEDALRNTCSY